MKFADLHLHTVFSDGSYTPDELISKASRAGLSAVSVVDHDTVSGIEQASHSGKLNGIEVLPGIELTAEHEKSEVHILGYLIDYKLKPLLEKLDCLRKERTRRVCLITDKLKKLGVNLEPEAVFDVAKEGTPGRLHIARAMVAEGFVKSTGEAFQKYIGDKCAAYVSGFKLSPAEGINLIRSAGGIPVLAHPYNLSGQELIIKLVDSGLMGLEIYYPEHTKNMIKSYLKLAKKYNLLVTGGSDCHGKAKPEVRIGSIKIPYELVEKLKSAKK